MTTLQKIKLDPVTLPDFLPGYDVQTFTSSMTQKEAIRIIRLAEKMAERGAVDEAYEVKRQIPLSPTAALTSYVLYGRENLLSLGFNLKDAELAYGPDWLDRFDVGEGVLDFEKDDDE